MICGHCKASDVDVTHVRNCAHTPGAALYQPENDPVTAAGIYRAEDRLYKVQAAVHGSGHLYAKEIVANDDGTVDFLYCPGAIRRLRASDRISLDEAKEFGALYGSCINCGRLLTNEDSIAAGIGPICAGRI